MPQSRLFAAAAGAFRSPFKGLAFFIWGFFVWCFLVHPESGILHGVFGDSDDAIHLVRVIEWLKGQNWYDPILHRLAPPAGVAIHYSRLAELPLAAMIGPLHALGASWIAAAYVAAFIWPLVLLGVFLAAIRWAAAPVLPAGWTRATAYVALFAMPLMMQFSPGRVDHHGLVAILVTMALGCVLRLMKDPTDLKAPIGAGFFLAFGTAVGLETLPWLLLFSGWIGVWTMMKGKGFAGSAILYGLSLYVFSVLFLLAAVAPDSFYKMNPLAFSYLYVALAGGIALALAAVGLASYAGGAWLRVAIGVLGVGCFVSFFLTRFPELAQGPYGGMDPDLADLMFSSISEALPLLRKSSTVGVFLATIFFPTLGLAASLGFMMKEEGEGLWRWLFLSLLLIAALFLGVSYQVRVLIFACLFAIVPLTALLQRGLASARATYRGRKLFAVELYLLLLVGPLASVFLPALTDDRSFREGVVLFPVTLKAESECGAPGLWQTLNLPGLYGDRPRLIMNSMNEGASILFHTAHKALAAPYHTNVKGNLDSTRFFRAKRPQEAEKIIRADKAELVLLCSDLPYLYRTKADETRIGADGKLARASGMDFAERLALGETPPWLKRVSMPFMGKVLLYEVRGKKKP